MVVKSRATREPGLGGTVNISELLINVVRFKRASRGDVLKVVEI